MPRLQPISSLLAGLLAASLLGAAAQEPTPEPAPPTVTVRPGLVVNADEPLVLWVATTTVTEQGQFATAEVYIQEVDAGFVQLTPCDDLVVACRPVTLRVEGVNQGDTFTLGGE